VEEDRIALQGSGPFGLGVIERTTVRALPSSIEITLYVTWGGEMKAVTFELAEELAQQLGDNIMQAILDLEFGSNELLK